MKISSVSNTTQLKSKRMKQDMNCESNVWEYELLDWISQEEINRSLLSRNPNAIHLLENNTEKINDVSFYTNSSIFNKRINYKYLYQRMNIIREELLMRCMHPSRLERWIEMGGEIDDF